MTATRRQAFALLAVALLPSLFLVANIHLPLMEDGLFWWVPRALLNAEAGPVWIAAGDLPLACLPHLPLPPQWSGGLPDYAHPPLWFWYLSGWLSIAGAKAWVVHAACLPFVFLLSLGFAALARRLVPHHAHLAVLPVLLSPPLLSQVLRPDTDLPLLTATVWSLVAILARRPWMFAMLASLAVWFKEPGLLLVVPAVVMGMRDRRFWLASILPPAALAAWAGIHLQQTGWALAGAERLPDGLGGFLADALQVSQIVMLDQGRWLVLTAALVGPALWAASRRPLRPLSPAPDRESVGFNTPHDPATTHDRWDLLVIFSFLATQLVVFSGLNFLGGREGQQVFTHIRYLLPAITTATLLGMACAFRTLRQLGRGRPGAGWALGLTALACAGLPMMGIRAPHPRGPEANLFGRDQARAWQLASPRIAAMSATTNTRVESYLFTALTRPYAGLVDKPTAGVLPFGPATVPEDLSPGDLLVHASYGEPLGRLGEWSRENLAHLQVGQAWVNIDRVLTGRVAAPPAARPPPHQPPQPR